MMQQHTRQAVSAERKNTYGGVALFLSLDVKYKKVSIKTRKILTHTARFLHTLATDLDNRSPSRRHKLEDLQSIFITRLYTMWTIDHDGC